MLFAFLCLRSTANLLMYVEVQTVRELSSKTGSMNSGLTHSFFSAIQPFRTRHYHPSSCSALQHYDKVASVEKKMTQALGSVQPEVFSVPTPVCRAGSWAQARVGHS